MGKTAPGPRVLELLKPPPPQWLLKFEETVLKVFETLLKQYQLDNRELVRKAIDVVTPAVPVRLAEEGYQLLLTQVKKILMEESHNMPQIQHVM